MKSQPLEILLKQDEDGNWKYTNPDVVEKSLAVQEFVVGKNVDSGEYMEVGMTYQGIKVRPIILH